MEQDSQHECTYGKVGGKVVCIDGCGIPVPDETAVFVRTCELSGSYRHNPRVENSEDHTFPPAIQKDWRLP